MRCVLKYIVPVFDETVHKIQRGAKFIHVNQQNGVPVLWFEVEYNETPVERIFQTFGTGQPIPANYDYVGTALCSGLVWHVYEKRTKPRPV